MADTYIWPLVAKDVVNRDGAMVLARGEGSYVFDVEGNFLMRIASSGVTRAAALGYSHPKLVAAVTEQVSRLQYAGQVEFQADVVFELADRLAALTPGTLAASAFTCSGTEANECAFKLAQLYHREAGRKPHAYKVISRWGAYHGEQGFLRFCHQKSVLVQSRWAMGSLFYPPYGAKFDQVMGLLRRWL